MITPENLQADKLEADRVQALSNLYDAATLVVPYNSPRDQDEIKNGFALQVLATYPQLEFHWPVDRGHVSNAARSFISLVLNPGLSERESAALSFQLTPKLREVLAMAAGSLLRRAAESLDGEESVLLHQEIADFIRAIPRPVASDEVARRLVQTVGDIRDDVVRNPAPRVRTGLRPPGL